VTSQPAIGDQKLVVHSGRCALHRLCGRSGGSRPAAGWHPHHLCSSSALLRGKRSRRDRPGIKPGIWRKRLMGAQIVEVLMGSRERCRCFQKHGTLFTARCRPDAGRRGLGPPGQGQGIFENGDQDFPIGPLESSSSSKLVRGHSPCGERSIDRACVIGRSLLR